MIIKVEAPEEYVLTAELELAVNIKSIADVEIGFYGMLKLKFGDGLMQVGNPFKLSIQNYMRPNRVAQLSGKSVILSHSFASILEPVEGRIVGKIVRIKCSGFDYSE